MWHICGQSSVTAQPGNWKENTSLQIMVMGFLHFQQLWRLVFMQHIYSRLPNSGIGSNNSIGWQMFEILIRV